MQQSSLAYTNQESGISTPPLPMLGVSFSLHTRGATICIRRARSIMAPTLRNCRISIQKKNQKKKKNNAGHRAQAEMWFSMVKTSCNALKYPERMYSTILLCKAELPENKKFLAKFPEKSHLCPGHVSEITNSKKLHFHRLPIEIGPCGQNWWVVNLWQS